MSDGYFGNDYGAQEDFDECYDDQLYGEEDENAYGQSQDDNEGEMDNYLAVQSGDQAENNIFSHGGKRSHVQLEHSNPNTTTSSSYNNAISYSTDETQDFQRDGSPSEGVLHRRQQHQQQEANLGTLESLMQQHPPTLHQQQRLHLLQRQQQAQQQRSPLQGRSFRPQQEQSYGLSLQRQQMVQHTQLHQQSPQPQPLQRQQRGSYSGQLLQQPHLHPHVRPLLRPHMRPPPATPKASAQQHHHFPSPHLQSPIRTPRTRMSLQSPDLHQTQSLSGICSGSLGLPNAYQQYSETINSYDTLEDLSYTSSPFASAPMDMRRERRPKAMGQIAHAASPSQPRLAAHACSRDPNQGSHQRSLSLRGNLSYRNPPSLQRSSSASTAASFDTEILSNRSFSMSESLSEQPEEQPLSPQASRARTNEEVAPPTPKKKKALETAGRLNRLQEMQEVHGGSSKWCQVYSELPLGTLPTPQELLACPPPAYFNILAKIPMAKSRRNDSVFGHFYKSNSTGIICCQAKGRNGETCRTEYRNKANPRTKREHLDKAHPGMREAVTIFRKIQAYVQNIPLKATKTDDDEDDGEGQHCEQGEFENLLLRLICEKGVAMNVVQDPVFLDVIKYINPEMHIPSDSTLWNRLNKNTINDKMKLKALLHQHATKGSITADSWTSIDKRKFLGVTFHYLTPQMTMSRMVLGMEEIHEAKQTWDVLLKYLNKILAFWNLEDKVVAATTDQGSNIKKCMSVFKESGTTWMPCASHCIQLHINRAWKDAEAERVLDKCQRISVYFRNNTVAMNKFREVQDLPLGNPGLSFQSMNATRWNSRHVMAQRVYALHTFVAATYDYFINKPPKDQASISDITPHMLTLDELNILADLNQLLGPAAAFTNWAGSTVSPTISRLYIKVGDILPSSNSIYTNVGRNVHRIMTDGIEKTWSPQEMPDVVLKAMYLNPATLRHKMWDTPQTGPHQTTLNEGSIMADMASTMEDQDGTVAGTAPTMERDAEKVPTMKDKVEDLLRTELFAKLRATKDPKKYKDQDIVRDVNLFLGQYESHVQEHEEDISNYLDTPHLYWKENNDMDLYWAKGLSDLAREYLSVQATSCEAERTFSKAGHIINALSTNINTSHFQDIIFSNSYRLALRQFEIMEK